MPQHDQFLWRPKDGEPLKVIDMADSHVVNAVNYFRRKVAEAEAQMPDQNFDFERIMGGTKDEFLCQAAPPFKYVLLEGKTRGIVQTNMTFAELIKLCAKGMQHDKNERIKVRAREILTANPDWDHV